MRKLHTQMRTAHSSDAGMLQNASVRQNRASSRENEDFSLK
jgi:hypothetical protein